MHKDQPLHRSVVRYECQVVRYDWPVLDGVSAGVTSPVVRSGRSVRFGSVRIGDTIYACLRGILPGILESSWWRSTERSGQGVSIPES